MAGALISFVGLFLRAWGSGHLRKNDALATSGPYAYTRNPLYLGSFIMGLGFTIASGRWPLGILFIALFLGIYLPVMRVESGYAGATLWRKFSRILESSATFFAAANRVSQEARRGSDFDRSLYMRYREYQAALGLLIAWGFELVF